MQRGGGWGAACKHIGATVCVPRAALVWFVTMVSTCTRLDATAATGRSGSGRECGGAGARCASADANVRQAQSAVQSSQNAGRRAKRLSPASVCYIWHCSRHSTAVCFYRRRLPAAREDKVEGVRVSGCTVPECQGSTEGIRVPGCLSGRRLPAAREDKVEMAWD